jgi:hypothetical protein
MTFVVYSPIIVGYDRSEFRAALGLGRQVQEVRLHDQLPRYRPSDRTFSARQSPSTAPPPLFAPNVDAQQALKIVVNYYHETLKLSPLAHQLRSADSPWA